jgi:hypothetical protein
MDGDAVRVTRSGQICRVGALVYVGNLRRCKRNDLSLLTVSITTIEDVKVAACSPHDDDSVTHYGVLWPEFVHFMLLAASDHSDTRFYLAIPAT